MTSQNDSQNIRFFNDKFTIEEARGKSTKQVKFDKFDKNVKLLTLEIEVWQTITEPDPNNANATIKTQRVILPTDPNREKIMLRMSTEGDEVKISGNQADEAKKGNVFSMIKLFESRQFKGWKFPRNAAIILELSHELPPNVVSKLGFPLSATVVASAEYLPDEKED